MTTTKRARKGGELGANGDFYEGGKFINTVPQNAKRYGSPVRKPSKVEIEPGVWGVAEDGKKSIYRSLAGIFGRVENGVMVLRTDDRMDGTLAYYGRTREEVKALADRWNAGERWL